MEIGRVIHALNNEAAGREMHALAGELFPLNRSRTGEGLRETLRVINRLIPLDIHEIPTGRPLFDWEAPQEWNVREAYIRGPDGTKIADFSVHNLHLMAYSIPVRETFPLNKLLPHLYSLPDKPDWIPYRTAYHHKDWGFCLTHRELEALQPGDYEVEIDSTLGAGSITYGEAFLPGESEDEVLVVSHCCHPSLANDNLSGIVTAVLAARLLSGARRRLGYRFLFAPSVVGPLAWLSRNESGAARIKHGLVLAGVGDSGPSTYKRSRRGDAPIDRAMEHVLRHAEDGSRIAPFTPYGYDERQFCSPGFDLPVGCLMRTTFGTYPEYHTSADNLSFIRSECLADSLKKCLLAFEVLETDAVYKNLNPKGEPQLGRRGLYRGLEGKNGLGMRDFALLWVLSFSDEKHSLLDIAEKAGIPFSSVRAAAQALTETGLIEDVT